MIGQRRSINKKTKVSTAVHKALISRRLFFISSFQFVSIAFRNSFYYYGGWVYCICELLMLYYDCLKQNNAINRCSPLEELYIYVTKPAEARQWVDDDGKPVIGSIENIEDQPLL